MTHPRKIFNFIWFFTTIVFLLSSSYYHGELPVLFVLFIGVVGFNIGSFINPVEFRVREVDLDPIRINKFLTYLLIVVIIGIIAQLKLFFDVEGVLAVKFFKVRHKISVEMIDFYGIWKYASTLSIFGMIISRLLRYKISKFFLLTSLILAILITGRSPVLQVLLYYYISGWLIEFNRKNVFKVTLFIGSFFVIFFFIFGRFTGKFSGTFLDALLALQHYFCGGIGALNVYILESGGLELFRYSDSPFVFRFIQAVVVKLGLSKSAVPLVLPFTYTPVRTNLYTQWFVYYFDFGLIGVGIFSFITGYLVQTVYVNYIMLKEKLKIILGLPTVLLVFLYQAILQTGLQENFFLIASSFFQIVLIWYVFKFYVLNRSN